MKLIIAGSRELPLRIAQAHIENEIGSRIDIEEVISGTARGADRAGEIFAEQNCIAVKKFPANWSAHGLGAGHVRNSEMAKYGTHLLLLWNGESPGSASMKSAMERLGKPVREIIIKTQGAL